MSKRQLYATARLGLCVACAFGCIGIGESDAQDKASEPGFFTGFSTRDTLLGDAGGLRTTLGTHGATLGLSEVSEFFGNVSGGTKRGYAYDGLTTLTLALDTQKAFGLSGGTFNMSVLQIHGRNLSADNLANLQTISGIEAQGTTRLWELWYLQTFVDGKLDLKLGQQSIDQEFIASQGSSLFVNTVMGWPMLPSADLYAGGPAYPLSSLGARLRGQPTGPVTLLAGIFNDNPPGGPFDDDAQLRGRERRGLKFNVNTGALFIGEIQYAINQPSLGDMDDGRHPLGLSGTYKLGAWYDTARFPDQRFNNTGLSLADPASSGIALEHRHNFSIYGVLDQTVWRTDPEGLRALSLFARVMGAPADRNLIAFSINAGVTLKAPIEGRDNDTVGVGLGIAKLSSRAADLDRDAAFFAPPGQVRTSETFVEVTYQYVVAPWWSVQPDGQYIFNPGGGVLNANTGKTIGNEAMVGVRTTINF